MPKFVKITRSDFPGPHYIVDDMSLSSVIESEFADLQDEEVGTTVTLEVVEMDQEAFDRLEDFEGW